MQAGSRIVAAATAAGVLAAAAYWWWWGRVAPQAPPPMIEAAAPAAEPPPVAPVAAVEIAASEPSAVQPPLEATALGPALADLLGADAAKRWLRTDDFARRFVATVDNLARPHAASMLWPVDPTAGRFTVIEREGRTMVSPDNRLRYLPVVQLVERLDSAATVTLYVRMLPLLQRAYEDLGYPGRRFHTRLLQVIDHLLAAPAAPEWIEVQLTQVRGPIPSERPWVRYEFADPALESASAGHKIMVRVGAENQRRLKAKLNELRAELLRRAER
jgi:hypothetical protein